MKISHNVFDFKPLPNAVLTTGTFDGVHIGHQKILKHLCNVADKTHGESVLLTFSPHPRKVLNPSSEIKLLNTLEEKIQRLEIIGIDHLIIHPFSKAFSRTTSLEFVKDIVVNQIGTKKLVIGYDHHFGRNREGSFDHLKEFGPLYGFNVEEIPAFDIDSVNVSSTKIRNALKEGDVETARQYLGYDYKFSGTVVKGNKLGRTIGFPTANISYESEDKLIPKNGVYAVRVTINQHLYAGMLNIGVKPTVSDDSYPTNLEVHIFDFDEDLYGQQIQLRFVKHMRNEQKFDSLEALKAQLDIDRTMAKSILL